MKKNILWVIIAVLVILLVGKAQQVNRLKSSMELSIDNNALLEYYYTTETLLEDLEYIDNLNGIEWGDTICESDIWYYYVEAKENVIK